VRINVTLRRVLVTVVTVEKKYVVHTLCVYVALVIQHAKRVRRIILSSVACPALSYFSTLCYKGRDFRKNVLNVKFVLIFSTTFV
jgi:hypothetical protein